MTDACVLLDMRLTILCLSQYRSSTSFCTILLRYVDIVPLQSYYVKRVDNCGINWYVVICT